MLFIEATAYPGKGKLTITGQLGDVMQESAQAALSWVRSHTEQLGPAGELVRRARRPHPRPRRRGAEGRALGGVTIATAIASLVRSEPVAEDVGMTGEITLTGQVLPIGGIREKVLAAQRYGLKRIVMPRDNEPDLDELPDEARKELEFILVDTIEEVFAVAFAQPRPLAAAGRAAPRSGRPPPASALCLARRAARVENPREQANERMAS